MADFKIKTKNLDADPEMLIEAIGKIFLQNIADATLKNTDDNINTDGYDTVRHAGTVIGIVDTSQYKNSWARDVQSPTVMIIGSIDKKARRIEWGSTGPDNSDLKDEEIIRWYRRNKIPNPVSQGKALAAYIREHGTPPKPAFRQGIDATKADHVKIERATGRQARKMLDKLLA